MGANRSNVIRPGHLCRLQRSARFSNPAHNARDVNWVTDTFGEHVAHCALGTVLSRPHP